MIKATLKTINLNKDPRFTELLLKQFRADLNGSEPGLDSDELEEFHWRHIRYFGGYNIVKQGDSGTIKEFVPFDEIDPKRYEKYFDSLADKVEKISNNKLSLQEASLILSMISFLLTLFTTYQSHQQSKKLENVSRDVESVNEEVLDLKSEISDLKDLKDKTIQYFEELNQTHKRKLLMIKKKSLIREKPSSKADTLFSLDINQVLVVKEDIEYWYRVEYYDPADSTLKTGWIYKGNVDAYNKPNN